MYIIHAHAELLKLFMLHLLLLCSPRLSRSNVKSEPMPHFDEQIINQVAAVRCTLFSFLRVTKVNRSDTRQHVGRCPDPPNRKPRV